MGGKAGSFWVRKSSPWSLGVGVQWILQPCGACSVNTDLLPWIPNASQYYWLLLEKGVGWVPYSWSWVNVNVTSSGDTLPWCHPAHLLWEHREQEGNQHTRTICLAPNNKSGRGTGFRQTWLLKKKKKGRRRKPLLTPGQPSAMSSSCARLWEEKGLRRVGKGEGAAGSCTTSRDGSQGLFPSSLWTGHHRERKEHLLALTSPIRCPSRGKARFLHDAISGG